MASILVTGGAGFIGSHIADALRRTGRHVVILDDLSGGRESFVPSGSELIRGSILDDKIVEHVFDYYHIEYVYHFAAFAAEGLSHFVRRHTYTTNVLGTAGLINQAVRHRCRGFVFASSVAVYGSSASEAIESMPPRPDDPYGISKYTSELDLAAANHMFGLPFIAFRLHNVYGPRQSTADRHRNVVGIFFRQLLRGEHMTVFGDGHQTRSFTYIDDLVSPLINCLDVPAAWGQVINLGADEPTQVLDLAGLVAEAVGLPCRVRHEPPRREARTATADHAKARTILGFAPRHPLREGLEATAHWIVGGDLGAIRSGPQLEVDLGLPPSWR